MAKNKIDLVKLNQLLREGKSPKEIAEFFHTSNVSVWKARRRLKNSVVKTLVLESAHTALQQDLNIRDELVKVNRTINEQLVEAKKDIAKASDGSDKRAARRIIINLIAEIRKQTETFARIAEAWDRHVELADFQKTVIDIVGGANTSPCCQGEVVCSKCNQPADLRSLIIVKLKQAKALRTGVTFRP